MPILSNFPAGGSGGGGIALSAVSDITTQVASGKVYVKWTDPSDLIVADSTLAAWGGTLLVRKAGSAPTSRRDGTVVLDSKTRDAYKTSYFCDSGLTDGTTYYYKFFPYTTQNAYTDDDACAFSATPTAQVSGIDNWVVTGMSASSEAGDGKMTIKWTDPAATITADGLTLATWASTTVVVKAGSYPTSKDDTGAAYTLKVTTRNQYASSDLTVTGLTNGTKYYIAFFPETTDGGINTATSQRTTGTANRITISTEPTQSGSMTYTGSAQTPSWSNYDSSKMTLSVTAQTNAGTYSASFTPTENYRWSDGTTTAKSVNWSIDKAAGSLTLSKSSITLNSSTKSTTFTVTRAGDGAITVNSSDTSVAKATLSGTTVTVSSVNETTGTATITVKVASGTNHNAPANKTVSISAEFLPAVGIALNNCSWDDISKIAAAGKAASYFAVGDRKAVALSGTVGQQSISGTYYVYIIGINHNSAKEGTGIQFGTFKTALSGGTDVCLIDSYYGSSQSYNGTKYFQMNHWGSSKNYNTNYGGWAACDMRYDILGSTDVAPSPYGSVKTTDATGNNPSATCATRPVANTLMAALPANLRAVMKPITKYTDNKGNSSNSAENVTATIDYLPLLSEFEVQGERKYANQYEQNYQAQYAYYSSGNSKVKYRHSDTSSTAAWWLRSPRYNTSGYFCGVKIDGSAGDPSASRSYGLAPAFRV